jgi:hypothetical protein
MTIGTSAAAAEVCGRTGSSPRLRPVDVVDPKMTIQNGARAAFWGTDGLLGEAMSDPLTNVRRVINSFVAQQRRGRAVVGVHDAHLQKPAMPCLHPKWLAPLVGR